MKNLEKVNYRGFIWPVIVGVILWLLTPMKPAAVPVAGWHMFAPLCRDDHCLHHPAPTNRGCLNSRLCPDRFDRHLADG